MRRFITLLLLNCIGMAGFSQASSELKSAYNQVVDLFKNYEISPQFMDGYNFTISPIRVIYKHPNLEISYSIKLKEGHGTFDDIAGNYKLICPMSSTKFSTHEDLPIGEASKLYIKNPDGIELAYKGRRQLRESYYFESTKITTRKLATALSSLQSLLLSENYRGTLGISNTSSSSSSFSSSSTMTTYKNAGFAIKKTYKLEENKLFIEMAKQTYPELKIVGAYQCAQNIEKNNPQLINIININVYEINNPAQTMEDYKAGLSENKIPYVNKTWNGLTGIEYDIKQDMGEVMLPTRAFYGYKGNKCYLVQLGSLTNYTSKFEELKSSITIL